MRRRHARSSRLPLHALLVLLAIAAPVAAEDRPVSTDTQSVLDHLSRTRQLFLDAIAGLTPEQWSWKPAPERWSVAECAEHITLSEAFLRDLLRGAIATPADPAVLAKSHGKSATILKFIVDRSQKFQAPEPINPANKSEIRSRAAIERDFNFERGRTHELVAGAGDLESYATMSPAFQELDLAGLAYFLSGHTERHTLQIQEVKSSPGWPGR
jgi:hypothetical protein